MTGNVLGIIILHSPYGKFDIPKVKPLGNGNS
jgi:hypothetical protein